MNKKSLIYVLERLLMLEYGTIALILSILAYSYNTLIFLLFVGFLGVMIAMLIKEKHLSREEDNHTVLNDISSLTGAVFLYYFLPPDYGVYAAIICSAIGVTDILLFSLSVEEIKFSFNALTLRNKDLTLNTITRLEILLFSAAVIALCIDYKDYIPLSVACCLMIFLAIVNIVVGFTVLTAGLRKELSFNYISDGFLIYLIIVFVDNASEIWGEHKALLFIVVILVLLDITRSVIEKFR
jgi:hypothetical protein